MTFQANQHSTLFPFQEYMSKAREFERHAKAANLEREQTDLQLQVSNIKPHQFYVSYVFNTHHGDLQLL